MKGVSDGSPASAGQTSSRSPRPDKISPFLLCAAGSSLLSLAAALTLSKLKSASKDGPMTEAKISWILRQMVVNKTYLNKESHCWVGW